MTHQKLIGHLVKDGFLKTPRIIAAFQKIDRADFVPKEARQDVYINAPLSIGWGQTISQPLTVAFMIELLEPKEGEKILDIGAGSGWQTAILAQIVGQKGKVFAMEIIPQLAEFGRQNVAKYNFISEGRAEFICADAKNGFSQQAPFDKIIAAASAQKIPEAWKKQLKTGGRIVTPIRTSIWLFIKKSEDKFQEFEYPGFAFVPLV